MPPRALALAFIIPLLVGCRSDPDTPERDTADAGIEIEDVWVRAMPDPLLTRTAAYLSIINRTETTDGLVGVDAAGVEVVELHETTMDGDVMRMRQVEAIDLPPGQRIELTPGGHHIMLIGVERQLVEGDSVSLTLRFASGYEQEVAAPVRPM